jgi:phosphatidylinositol alpha-1,6-mannosyltransferase
MRKILLISSEFPPLPGGIGNHALNLALYLQRTGRDITVMTNQRSKEIVADISFDNGLFFKVLRIKRHNIAILTFIDRIYQAMRFVRANKGISIIGSGKFSLWQCAFLKIFFRDRKYVAILHGSEINAGGKISKIITRWSMRRFDYLIAVSEFTKNMALKKDNSLVINIINNGFSFSVFELRPNVIPVKGNPAIVTVGNVSFRKGQQNVINALPTLKERFPEIHYHMIGIPTEKGKFSILAESLGVSDNITFHGVLSWNDLVGVVSQCKVIFMLSDNLKNGDVEGFGIAILEANHIGLPAIGSKNSGIADAISDSYSGRLVNQHDVNDISDAFAEIMHNYNAYSNGAKTWTAGFDWEIIGRKYLDIIDK